jgi:tetratricopeptide (TPR) repeat protein
MSGCGNAAPDAAPTATPEADENTSVVIPNIQSNDPDADDYPAPNTAAQQNQDAYPGPGLSAQEAYPLPEGIDLALDASAEEIKEQVDTLIDQGRYVNALSVVNRAIYGDETQDNLDILAIQAHVLIYLNRYREAQSNFTTIFAQDPDNTLALLYNGFMHRRLGQLDSAVSSLSQLIEQEPENAQALVERARTYLAQQNYDQALADANAALEINDQLPWAYVVRAQVQAAQDNHEEARENFEQAVEVAENTLEPAYEYGLYLVGQSDQEAAREQFEYVLNNAISPRDDVLMRRSSLRLNSLSDETDTQP